MLRIDSVVDERQNKENVAKKKCKQQWEMDNVNKKKREKWKKWTIITKKSEKKWKNGQKNQK